MELNEIELIQYNIVKLAFVSELKEMQDGLFKIGIKNYFEHGTIVMEGVFPCGFSLNADPPTRATLISMSLAGSHFIKTFPTLLKAVDTEWKSRTKKLKKGLKP